MRIFRENIWRKDHSVMPQKVRWSYWNDCFLIPEGEVCFNVITGSLVLMSNSEYENLSKAKDCTKELWELGLYADASKDEYRDWLNNYREGKNDESFLDLTFLTSRQCQFKCTYCFEGSKPKNDMTDETITHIKSFLEKRKGSFQKLQVYWFGGEPLIGYNKIITLSHYITHFCDNNRIVYDSSITTNGYALNREKCEELVKTCRISRYVITIDGTEEVHNRRRPLLSGNGTFKTIWQNIHCLVDLGANVVFRITIDKENVDNIPSLLDKIAQSDLAGKVNIALARTFEILNTPEDLTSKVFSEREFAPVELKLIDYAHSLGLMNYRLPHKAPLGGCLRKGDITIGTDGEIYKCLDTIGEVKWVTGSIDKIDSEPQPQWYKDYLSWTPDDSNQCMGCKLQPLCSGGCPHNAIFSDKMHGSVLQCPDWKLNYRNQIERYIKEKTSNGRYKQY